jgi:hypothetical protein
MYSSVGLLLRIATASVLLGAGSVFSIPTVSGVASAEAVGPRPQGHHPPLPSPGVTKLSPEAAEAVGLPRSTVDRPDDVGGSQIHVVYVVPSDGTDRGLDTDGHLASSALAFNQWLGAETSGRELRLDTYQGSVDVTFFRLSRTDAQVRSGAEFGHAAYVRDIIEKDMIAAGFNKANTLYAAYYDGHSDWSCGGGAWPPALPGTVGAMYLRGLPGAENPCSNQGLPGSNLSAPNYFDFGMLHELMHTMGFVPACAPNEQASGHVPEPNDLLYGGGTAFWDLAALELDVGRSDYFQHSNDGCIDLDESSFLKPAGPADADGDYDGDGDTDVAVFRPSNGIWFVQGGAITAWGTEGDIATPADYDGDGTTDLAVFRPSMGVWFVEASTAGESAMAWGTAGDLPVPADYDGDGTTDLGVFRPSLGVWFIRASTAGEWAMAWGSEGDVPVPADYDGDTKVDVAVFRPSLGVWFVHPSGGAADSAVAWGTVGDVPAPGDYDGDGRSDAAVFRPSAGVWFLRPSGGTPATTTAWGTRGDVPAPGDYDRDGRRDLAVFRPAVGVWFLHPGSARAWGAAGDVALPLPAAIREVYFP